MGCWDDFCSVTRLPIRPGDRIVVIEAGPQEYTWSTYDFAQSLHNRAGEDFARIKAQSEFVEKLVLGEVRAEDEDAYVAAAVAKVPRAFDFMRGSYDDYGGCEDVDGGRPNWRPWDDRDGTPKRGAHVLIHEDVFDEVLAFMRAERAQELARETVSKYEFERDQAARWLKTPDDIRDVTLFTRYCHTNRIQMFDTRRLLGHQHLDRETLVAAAHLARTTRAKWLEQDARVREYEDEESDVEPFELDPA